MRLPDFLVIGAKKAGSTWLDRVLRSHPGIALPAARKEVAFFDLYYDRGLAWYARYFERLPAHALVGESTPEYMHHPEAPARIERDLPRARLVAILRNPVDRIYSEWSHHAMRFADPRSFEQFIHDEPGALAKSQYAEQLHRFPRARSEGRLHVVILEEALREPGSALDALGAFLGLEPAGFDAQAQQTQNESYQPRFRRGFALARTFSDWLRKQELDAVANIAKHLGARRLFGRRGRFSPMTAQQRATLADVGDRACSEMEALLGRSIDVWRQGAAVR